MATRPRNRIVVRSKSKTSVMSPTSSSLSGRSSSSETSTYTVPVMTSTPVRQVNHPGLPPLTIGGGANSTLRPHSRHKSGNKVRPILPDNYYRNSRVRSVSNGLTMPSFNDLDESSSSDGDDVFRGNQSAILSQTTPISHLKPSHNARPMYFSTSQLLPSLYVAPNNKTRAGTKVRRNQILPVLPPISKGLPASPSPSLNSSFSFVSSPLPPLLIQSMRKGGNKPSLSSNWKRDTVLESILPNGVLKVFVGTWNMNGIKVNSIIFTYTHMLAYMLLNCAVCCVLLVPVHNCTYSIIPHLI